MGRSYEWVCSNCGRNFGWECSYAASRDICIDCADKPGLRTVADIRHYCQQRLSMLRDLEKEHGGYNFRIGEYVDLMDFIDGRGEE